MINRIAAFLKIYRVQIIVWAIFIFFEVTIVGFAKGSFGSFFNYFIHYCLNISIFYIHAFWLLPLAYKHNQNKALRITIYVLFELTIFISVVYFIDLLLITQTNILRTNVIESHIRILLGITWRTLYFMLFGTGYYFFIAYKREREIKEEVLKNQLMGIIEKQKIETDLIIAKNAYLKAQINPHFLFNTLDFIYHDVVQHSNKSADAILDLVEIMRYALDVDYLGKYVEMGTEIEQVKILVNLHRLRSDGKESVAIHYDDDLKSLKIIPLVLLTLVENMFKHGNLKDQEGQINMYIKDGRIYVHTINMMYEGRQAIGFGSGLSNIEQRLVDTYKGDAEFRYGLNRNTFEVSLSVPIAE